MAILLVYVSFLACCSALCIFEKHMFTFVDLIHALPTRGRDSTQFLLWEESTHFMHPGGVFASSGRNVFVQGELAFMCFGALCA